MVNFQESPNYILDAIEKIYNVSEESHLNPEKLLGCQKEIEDFSIFFNCHPQAAILLAILLRQHYQNEEPSVRDLIEHTRLKGSATVYINRLLDDFVKRNWIKPKQDIRYFPYTNYKFYHHFIHSVTTCDLSHLESKPIKSSFDLLYRFSKTLKERKTNEIQYEKLLEYTESLLSENKQLHICDFIQKLRPEPLEAVLFLSICYRHYKGDETFDFDSLLEEVGPSLQDQFRFRQQIKNKKNIFFELELVDEKKSDGLMFSLLEYRLTDEVLSSINPEHICDKKRSSSNMFHFTEPSKIKTKNLYYGKLEKIQMDRLFDLTRVENFDLFCNRMKEKGMKSGLTILLYGAPGTGKTESVLQIALMNSRAVLTADASNIRSKWVGETEKNIKRLFKDYRQAVKEYDRVPILLFNEADAILGSRRTISDRVEQMENTLQNILLQELEDFEGIFIATTNLEENLDPAFDRRILYKVHFNSPTDEVRESIWKDKLKDIPENQVQEINRRYKLTGGQIDNVVKKIEVSQLLDPKLAITPEFLFFLAEEEVSLRANRERTPIGFTIKKSPI